MGRLIGLGLLGLAGWVLLSGSESAALPIPASAPSPLPIPPVRRSSTPSHPSATQGAYLQPRPIFQDFDTLSPDQQTRVVTIAQQQLNALNYMTPLEISGSLDGTTIDALQTFAIQTPGLATQYGTVTAIDLPSTFDGLDRAYRHLMNLPSP